MFSNPLKKIFRSHNEREIEKISHLVQKINAFEPALEKLTLEELQKKTFEFKERLSKGESLEELLPNAFAVVRETSKRVLSMRHFDVQLIGGVVLHQGKVSEMKTGEGKTLVATLSVYLNALTGRGVHIITVNDYLAQRDSEWMGTIYKTLGLSVGVIVHGLSDQERKDAYACDITYGTNNEFGFDYLRDNMKFRLSDYVQRELNYAIVDEVDSILIDEARTPLIISGPTEESTEKYYHINQAVHHLKKDIDYTTDEKSKSASLTEEGVTKLENLLHITNLYAPEHMDLVHHAHQALKAHAMFKRDVDYVVKEGEVIIVDEFTGRLMPGRRFSDGLHQALEAKEGVRIENENQTLATITFQNYFRLYNKLAGMTGTADTEASEFQKIYNLEVLVIPTNKPMIRIDAPDVIYKTEKAKFNAICDEIIELHEKNIPVLVGTISIERSELLSKKLKAKNIPHNVLNAKHHEREAEIISEAGKLGAITIATNMAGRGTDIKLGEGVAALGGLHIIGSERHESRRIDNQLRGRAGRQGDPGYSKFFLSLEDDLMRIFQGERLKNIMTRLKMEDDVPIENRLITRTIENAQKKVEAHNFDIRKHLLEYDDVLNKQRQVVYELRKLILQGGDGTRDLIFDILKEQLEALISEYAQSSSPNEWDKEGIVQAIILLLHHSLGTGKIVSPSSAQTKDASDEAHEPSSTIEIDPEFWNHISSQEQLIQELFERAKKLYAEKEKKLTAPFLRELEQFFYLGSIDQLWKEHLLNMDHLKEGVSLRGYGQKDPLVEYKKEGFYLFKMMDDQVKSDVISKLFRVDINQEEKKDNEKNEMDLSFALRSKEPKRMELSRGESREHPHTSQQHQETIKRSYEKIGRNDPCPCGSGKKYKKCHGLLEE